MRRLIEVDGVTYVVLPGPRGELKPMVNEQLSSFYQQEQLFQSFCASWDWGKPAGYDPSDIIEEQEDPTLPMPRRRSDLAPVYKGKADQAEACEA